MIYFRCTMPQSFQAIHQSCVEASTQAPFEFSSSQYHARAIDAVLHKGKVGETYLVGGMEKLIPNIEVVKRILKLMNKDENND